VTVRALRYYEEMDLIGPVKRTAGKYRLYSQQTMKRVKAICALQALGYSLETIAAMLGPFSQSVGLSKGEQIDRSRQFLESQKACITEKMWELQTMLSEIDQRLGCLNSACVECLQHKPLDPCEEHCEDRQVHLN
jgi:DNA-binding transcriptional MerR regulator